MARKLAYLAAAALAAFALRSAFPGDRLVLRVFDVGQGDAILVQCGRHQLLVDAGPDAGVLAKLGRAMPLFDRDIDAVVITHPHADHDGGLAPVLRRYRVGRLFTSGYAEPAARREVDDDAAAAGLEPTPLLAGDAIAVGGCGAADVLWPAPGVAAAAKHPHEAMVVLRVHAPSASSRAAVLLMGDADQGVERALMDGGAPLAADVLKVGHHGSRTSSSGPFLDAVRPSSAVVSCGRRNRYGHPHAATLLRLAARGVAVRRTDRDGDVEVRADPDRAYVAGP